MILFSKYHGCGNSFVIIKESQLRDRVKPEEYPQLAVRLCDVNCGVGADGMMVVRQEPRLEMLFFNCDGSRAPMCGNGIRCFAHFCSDEGIRDEEVYTVETLSGERTVQVASREPFRVKINMGAPVYNREDIKVTPDVPDAFQRDITLEDGRVYGIDSLFMGTIHTVLFTDNLEDRELPQIGEAICNHRSFREKTNVNFVKVIDDKTLEVKTYERGVGMTLACGTGACASVVVANRRGFCGKAVKVILERGYLDISIDQSGEVYMEGLSERIFTGTLT